MLAVLNKVVCLRAPSHLLRTIRKCVLNKKDIGVRQVTNMNMMPYILALVDRESLAISQWWKHQFGQLYAAFPYRTSSCPIDKRRTYNGGFNPRLMFWIAFGCVQYNFVNIPVPMTEWERCDLLHVCDIVVNLRRSAPKSPRSITKNPSPRGLNIVASRATWTFRSEAPDQSGRASRMIRWSAL